MPNAYPGRRPVPVTTGAQPEPPHRAASSAGPGGTPRHHHPSRGFRYLTRPSRRSVLEQPRRHGPLEARRTVLSVALAAAQAGRQRRPARDVVRTGECAGLPGCRGWAADGVADEGAEGGEDGQGEQGGPQAVDEATWAEVAASCGEDGGGGGDAEDAADVLQRGADAAGQAGLPGAD